jgi:hypothetical protein
MQSPASAAWMLFFRMLVSIKRIAIRLCYGVSREPDGYPVMVDQ